MTATLTRASLRQTGRLTELSAAQRRSLVTRGPAADAGIAATTARIIADVRARGDAALYALARELDGVELDALEVPRTAVERALNELDGKVRRALERSAANIASVHGAFMPRAMESM